ncbi:phosphoglycerate kinase [Geodermatophilus bullaregiensis]|uniref:phosphoglycerate kinase n=1 Tax=Geodermatophilus bullaregiensis TaxID=1564160 RepID=UPI00195C79A4|nr:phosphoglycerate kinase [Geodermatophilus bullaregiensis]MBM7808580.1 phosphoglycerate kinase [Geodermatophilus bullaregiensis]
MRALDDLLAEGVSGRRVLVRADLNVPLDKQTRAITDDGRIRASLPTLQALREGGARVVVAAHLGRPKGAPDPQYSLAPVAARLGELLGTDVPLAADVAGDDARARAAALGDGDVLLVENVRFEAAETSKDDAERGGLADRLAALADVYVDDAFGAVHRKHASVYDVAQRLPHVAGRLVATELDVLTRLTTDPARPYVVVLGGSKVSDKLAVIEALLPKVDRLLVGGGMCFTFLAAQGHGVGKSLLEADQVDTCRRLLADAGDRIVLPVDVVCAPEFSADVETTIVPVEEIPDEQLGLDVGPRTVEAFGRELAGARTVFWNGPMGVFELAPFQAGTRGVAEAVAAVDGLSVVGGGDSAAAVRQLGLDESAYGHISTGGGASLEYLEGRELPGLAVLAEGGGT